MNLQGMHYLYANGVQHRDLKADNCLVVEHKSGDFRVKLADFGLSKSKKLVASFTRRRPSQHGGTVTHMAPEILLNDSDQLFYEESDVYSYGIVMWEVLSRAVPFEGLNRAQIIAQVIAGKRPPIPEDSPPEMIELMEKCWHDVAFVRPSFKGPTGVVGAFQKISLG